MVLVYFINSLLHKFKKICLKFVANFVQFRINPMTAVDWVECRDLHGDRIHTHPHPSRRLCFHPHPSPSMHFQFRPRTTSISSPPVPVNIYSITVPELTASNRSNINSDAMKEISINSTRVGQKVLSLTTFR